MRVSGGSQIHVSTHLGGCERLHVACCVSCDLEVIEELVLLLCEPLFIREKQQGALGVPRRRASCRHCRTQLWEEVVTDSNE